MPTILCKTLVEIPDFDHCGGTSGSSGCFAYYAQFYCQ
jgi:hypothetical protein